MHAPVSLGMLSPLSIVISIPIRLLTKQRVVSVDTFRAQTIKPLYFRCTSYYRQASRYYSVLHERSVAWSLMTVEEEFYLDAQIDGLRRIVRNHVY